MTDDEIAIMYAQVANGEDTETRMRVFKRYSQDLPNIDNYNCGPGQDQDFEKGYHRWLYLYQLTNGVERAAVINLAVQLFENSPLRMQYQTHFFEHSFSDATRDYHYAKAMCMLYRNLLTNED